MERHKKFTEARKLRLEGKTYGEIRELLGIPKSTQSSWFKDMELPREASEVLKSKQTKGLIALGKWNTARTIKNDEENKTIRKLYEEMVKAISDRDLMLIGASLYWAEGYKNFGKKRYIQMSFANSDAMMILVFIEFVERILHIDRRTILGEVMIHKNVDKQLALEYWIRITKIPASRFHCYQFESSASKGKRPSNLLPYGTLQLKIHKRQEFFKIRGLIDGIINSTVPTLPDHASANGT